MNILQHILADIEQWYMALPTHETPGAITPQDKVAAIVLQKNNAITFLPGGTLTNVTKGTVIHKIDGSEATQLAAIIVAETDKRKFPLSYALADLDIESAFDPTCVNGNFAGSNKEKADDGFDDGIAQEKLKYLIGSHGINDVDEAKTFALDPTKAIPYMLDVMQERLAWADKTIAAMGDDSSILPQFRNRWYLATGAYNFGEQGMTELLKSETPPSHCEIVKALEISFAKTLGEKSVFADIEG